MQSAASQSLKCEGAHQEHIKPFQLIELECRSLFLLGGIKHKCYDNSDCDFELSCDHGMDTRLASMMRLQDSEQL